MNPLITLALIILALSPSSASAQPAAPLSPAFSGQFSDTPICSDLINKSGYTVYGNIETARVDLPEGTAYHKSNFRLSKDETTKICARGPFFEGGKLRLVLRSLLPVFECKTRLGQPITITATPKKPIGYDWKATCYE